MNRIIKLIDHNRFLAIGTALWAAVAVWLGGCQATTNSYLGLDGQTPEGGQTWAEVQREAEADAASLELRQAELVAEGEAIAGQVEAAATDINQTTEKRRNVINFAIGAITSAATGTPLGAAEVIGGILGLGLFTGGTGAIIDNRRKDKVIKRLKPPTNEQGDA